jgi:hypothetical protein
MEDCLIIRGLLKQVVVNRQNFSADSKVDHPGRKMKQFNKSCLAGNPVSTNAWFESSAIQ